jgi:hypothetical protein
MARAQKPSESMSILFVIFRLAFTYVLLLEYTVTLQFIEETKQIAMLV